MSSSSVVNDLLIKLSRYEVSILVSLFSIDGISFLSEVLEYLSNIFCNPL